MKPLFVLLAGALLASCVSNETTSSVQPDRVFTERLPFDYKAQIKTKIKYTFVDPHSLQDAEITGPMQVFVGALQGGRTTGVCVRFNPKNNYGAYDGMKTFIAGFKGGKLMAFHAPIYTDCNSQSWRAWPDIN